MKKQTILLFCAHNDDNIIGAGGTIANYIKEGHEVFSYIFSFGEKSHPHFKKKEVIKMRIKESVRATKILGDKIHYFGLQEGNFEKEVLNKKIKSKIISIIESKKPKKIFVHSGEDPHPDHKAVYKTIKSIVPRIDNSIDIYSFDVWNPIRLKNKNAPKLVVDISKTFNKKIQALKAHKSQKLTWLSLMWNIYRKAILNGIAHNAKYAEVFYKIK